MGLRSSSGVVAAAATAVSLLTGCGAESGGTSPSGSSEASAIIHGKDDADAHDAVVLIALQKEGRLASACTGTMVAPNLVLTARHCVSATDRAALCRADGSSYEGGEITGDFEAGSLNVYTGELAMQTIKDEGPPAAHGKLVIVERTQTLCDRDVAFILLDRAVDTEVAPIRLKLGPREGESLIAVGWGLTENGTLPNKRMQRSGVRVAAVGPLVLDEDTEVGISRSEFAVHEAFCSGDSGGPAFSSTGAVVGVVSRGGNGDDDSSNRAASCVGADVVGYYTHLANKKALVARAFELAGYQPRDETKPPGKANGTTCSINSDCSSNACDEGHCRARCDIGGVCRTGEVCTTKGVLHVCLAAATSTRSNEEAAPIANALPEPAPNSSLGCAASPARDASSGGALVGFAVVCAVAHRARRRR
jgi:hypothetical protein